MCGIGRERRFSHPSHDTSGYWACSQVALSILPLCRLWVALLPSGCLWCRENKIAIKFVTPAWGSLRGGLNTPLTDRLLGVNLGDVHENSEGL